MIPDVAQQLSAIRQTVAKAIIPAIDAEDSFALEQAGLILASLDWLLDIQEEQEHYFRVEVEDQQALLAALVAIDPESGAAAAPRSLSAEKETVTSLRDWSKDLKQRTTAAFDRLTATPGPEADGARRLFDEYGRRQLDREMSWCRKTGFPGGSPVAIGSVLNDQQANR